MIKEQGLFAKEYTKYRLIGTFTEVHSIQGLEQALEIYSSFGLVIGTSMRSWVKSKCKQGDNVYLFVDKGTLTVHATVNTFYLTDRDYEPLQI